MTWQRKALAKLRATAIQKPMHLRLLPLRYILPVIFVVSVHCVHAQKTVPSGTVSGVWLKKNSPYLVSGHITIPNDSTLQIEPGVHVEFQDHYELQIEGRILATGNAKSRIVFTAKNTNSSWGGLHFDETDNSNDSSLLLYCVVKHGAANTQGGVGGALYIKGFSKLRIGHCSIIRNAAWSRAGGIYCEEASPIIANNFIAYNTVWHGAWAGAMYCYRSSPLIKGNRIVYNDYGGVYTVEGVPTIVNNDISYNNKGNGIYYSNVPTPIADTGLIAGNTITYNESTRGGGIYCYKAPLIIENNTISYNKGGSYGGGILIQGTESILLALLRNNEMVGNEAHAGGAIYAHGRSGIFNNTIIGNKASKGGAIYHHSSYESEVIGNFICNNEATSGGASFFHWSRAKYYNNTIVNNKGSYGGALYFETRSEPIFVNNILFGNRSQPSAGHQIHIANNLSTPTFEYCNIEDGTDSIYNAGYLGFYSNNIEADPLFTNPSNSLGNAINALTADWSLKSTSPCIDAGTSDTAGMLVPVDDIRGNSRVAGNKIDMGAIEYCGMGIGLLSVRSSAVKLCPGDSVKAFATGANSYRWNTADTTDSIVIVNRGSYYVSGNIKGCWVRSEAITIVQLPNNTPNITIAGDTSFCKGDSVWLSTDTATSYRWSNGAASRSIRVDSSGSYWVSVTDSNGCHFTSQPAEIIAHKLPKAPVVYMTNDTLVASTTVAKDYQWYRNDTIISGARFARQWAFSYGSYKVEITDSNGCTSVSKPFDHLKVGIANEEPITFQLAPNPASTVCRVVASHVVNNIQLYDMNGRLLLESNDSFIDIRAYQKGVYMVVLTAKGSSSSLRRKLIIH